MQPIDHRRVSVQCRGGRRAVRRQDFAAPAHSGGEERGGAGEPGGVFSGRGAAGDHRVEGRRAGASRLVSQPAGPSAGDGGGGHGEVSGAGGGGGGAGAHAVVQPDGGNDAGVRGLPGEDDAGDPGGGAHAGGVEVYSLQDPLLDSVEGGLLRDK